MRTTTKKLLAIALVGVMVASAGCTGWGSDGPADSDESDGNDTGDDLADEQNQSQNPSSDSSDSGSDSSDSSGTSSGDSTSDTDSDSDSDSESDASSDSSSSSSPSTDSTTDSSDDSSESSDCPTDGCPDQSDDTDGATDDTSDSDPQGDEGKDSTSDGSDRDSDTGDGTDGDDGDDTDDSATHELKVTVTDPDENPVEGASVSIVTYDGGADVASGTTNSDGVATFDVPNGEYEVVVTTEDDELLQPSDQRLVTVNGGDANLDVQMQGSGDNGGGEETHTLTVHADSAVTLKSIDEEGVSETKEPTDGVVTFEVLNGEYTLTAEGYSRADYVPIDSDTEIELQSTDGATMDITVTDAETGDPVKGAEMDGECDLWYSGGDSYIETTSASGADGIVTVRTGVTPTTCEPTVSADGYETVTIGLDAPDDDGRTIELEPAETAVPEPPANETGNETNGNATAALA